MKHRLRFLTIIFLTSVLHVAGSDKQVVKKNNKKNDKLILAVWQRLMREAKENGKYYMQKYQDYKAIALKSAQHPCPTRIKKNYTNSTQQATSCPPDIEDLVHRKTGKSIACTCPVKKEEAELQHISKPPVYTDPLLLMPVRFGIPLCMYKRTVPGMYWAVAKTYDRRDVHGSTFIHEAARKGSIDWAKKLVYALADVNSRNCFDQTPLTCAILANKTDVACYLAAVTVNINRYDLDEAINVGNEEMCTAILRSCPDLARDRTYSKETPLFEAARSGYQGIYNLLKEYGAEENIRNALGKTAKEYIYKRPAPCYNKTVLNMLADDFSAQIQS